MVRHYNAFLVRPQPLTNTGEASVEIVHLQSGARALAPSLATAVNWMQHQTALVDSVRRDERSRTGVVRWSSQPVGGR